MQGQDFLIQLLAKLDTSSVNEDYEKLKKKLTSGPFIQKLTFDTSMSKQAIKAMASEIQNELSKAFKSSGVEELDITVKDVESILSNAVKQSNKLASEIDKSSNSAQKFLARFNNKTGGTLINSKEFKEVQDAINGLGKTHSIDQLNASMDKLETTYNNMVANLRTGSKSLNPFVNAITDMNNMDKTIKDIELQFKSLSSQPKAVADSIKQLSAQQSEVNKYAQGTLEWSQAYGKLKSSITSVKAELSNLSKSKNVGETTTILNTADLDKQGKIYVQKVSNTVEKMKSELSSKMKSAGYFDIDIKGVEDATGKIKSLTATATDANGVLKQLSFTREKLQGKGKAQAGFVQTDDVKVLGTVSDLAQKSISSLDTMKQEWADNGILVGEFKNKVDQLESAFANVSSKGGLETLKGELQSLKLEADKITQANKIQLSLDDGTYETKVENLIAKTRQWTDENNNARISTTNLSTAWNNLATAQNDQDKIKYAQELDVEIKKVTNDVKIMNSNLAKDSAVSSFHQQLQEFKDKNGKAMVGEWKAQINDMLAKTASGSKVANAELIKMKETYLKIGNAAREAGKLGKSFTQSVIEQGKKFSQWVSVSSIVMQGITQVKQAMTELKEVDTYLTEISKANDSLSKSQLAEIGTGSFDIASKYGKQATNYLSAMQETSRAGYKNAEGMAELSVAVQGAGDVTEETANKYVIATDKAWKLNGAVSSLTEIFDGANKITNENAVKMEGLADGMSIVGSTAASFGISAKETTAALGTMIATTQQEGSEVARAFRAILLNIRQVSDEEEGIDAEGLTKYEKACNALNVSLKETKNGVQELRDPMEVLHDLSVEYNKLDENDIKRTQLLNSVGGKLRSTQLDALLRQWDTYEKMLGDYENGSGSMAAEAEKTAQSWEGSLNRLSNSWTKFIDTITNQDALIDGINLLSKFVGGVTDLTDKIGVLPTLSIGAGLFAGIKNFGKYVQVYGFQKSFVNCFEYALHT